MLKRTHIFLIEFLKELPFMVIIGLLIFAAMGYGAVGLEDAFNSKNTFNVSGEYANSTYSVDFSTDLYGKEGFEDKDLGYINFTTLNDNKKAIEVCEINDNALKIFDIHNKNLFTKTSEVALGAEAVRDALVLPQFESDYKIGDIINSNEIHKDLYISYPIKIVGFLGDKTIFPLTRYKEDFKILIYNHSAGVEFPRQSNANFYVHSKDGTEFYTETYAPFECRISAINVTEEHEKVIENDEKNALNIMFGIFMILGVFFMVMLLYSACKNDYYAKKFAVYNLYGEKKSTRFIFEMIKTLIVVAVPSVIQYVIYVSTSFYSSVNNWWTMSNTVNLITLLVVAISYILINTVVNTQILFRKSLKKIGE